MLFALFRRSVFQSRGTLLRISSPGIATKVMFACLFGHSSISVSCRELTMNRSQPFGLAGSDCLDLPMRNPAVDVFCINALREFQQLKLSLNVRQSD